MQSYEFVLWDGMVLETNTLGLLLLLCVLISLYFAPTLIAKLRQHRNLLAIFVLNLLTGWMVVGWIAALVWSCTAQSEKGPDGGKV